MVKEGIGYPRSSIFTGKMKLKVNVFSSQKRPGTFLSVLRKATRQAASETSSEAFRTESLKSTLPLVLAEENMAEQRCSVPSNKNHAYYCSLTDIFVQPV